MCNVLYEYRINHEFYEKTVVDSEKCVHCGYCVFACTEEVIKVDEDIHVPAVVNPDNCDSCNMCACPFGAREFLPYNEGIANEAYALIGTQEYVR